MLELNDASMLTIDTDKITGLYTKDDIIHTYYYAFCFYERIINDLLSNHNMSQIKRFDLRADISDVDSYIMAELNICNSLKLLLQKESNIVYGNVINPTILLSAWASGCLFIRKCMNNSKIDSYSQLINNIY